MFFLANSVDRATFSPVFREGSRSLELPGSSGLFAEFGRSRMLFADRNVTSLAMRAANSFGTEFGLARLLPSGLPMPEDAPVWIEMELAPDFVADVFPLVMATNRIGCLFLPFADEQGGGAGVRACLVVSPMRGKALALPVDLRCRADGELAPKTSRDQLADSLDAPAGMAACIASAVLELMFCGLFVAKPGPAFDRENAARARRGKPPLLTCEEVMDAGALLRPTVGAGDDARRVGWIGVVNVETGFSEVRPLNRIPDTFREINDRMVANSVAHVRRAMPSLGNDVAAMAFLALGPDVSGAYADAFGNALAAELGSPVFGIIRTAHGISLRGLVFEGDTASEAARLEVEEWIESERSEGGNR